MTSALTHADVEAPGVPALGVPHESLGRLFLRFLRFGGLAWGGPVAQIAMIRQELVEDERWVTSAQFNRALAVYQVLPGPEAHELCVYFGTLSRGRVGGLLAGLGFMLPGFLLMFALSWAYVRFGLTAAGVVAVFAAMQAAVAALIVRAVHRIGSHVVTDRWLWGIAIAAAAAQLAGIHFAIILVTGGLLYAAAKRATPALALSAIVVLACGAVAFLVIGGIPSAPGDSPGAPMPEGARQATSLSGLFWSGLKAGLLTFGGAYTVIPFLQEDAVSSGAWMTNAQFLDGLALSGLLPAPLIIFSTFVGYIAGGLGGALAMTIGIFIPAFVFPIYCHRWLVGTAQNPRIRPFLLGVAAGVIGLIGAVTIDILDTSVVDVPTTILAVAAFLALYRWHAKLTVVAVVLSCGLAGVALQATGAV
jgi:chromate transporter